MREELPVLRVADVAAEVYGAMPGTVMTRNRTARTSLARMALAAWLIAQGCTTIRAGGLLHRHRTQITYLWQRHQELLQVDFEYKACWQDFQRALMRKELPV